MAHASAKGNGLGGTDSGPVCMRRFLEVLAKKGFDVNSWVNQDGESPLHACAKEGEVEMVDVLLEMKADVHCTCESGVVPLVAAAEGGHADVVSLLLKHGARTYPGIFALHKAAYRGHPDVVTSLLAAGADVGEEDDSGRTPARNCVVVSDEDGALVGDMAATLQKRKAEALSLVLQGGGDINEIAVGWSLLHGAADFNLSECVAVLVARGMDVDVTSGDEKRTPLHTACYEGNMDVLKELAKLGASLNVLDTDGCAPLYDAVMGCHDDCVGEIISLGADVMVKTEPGFTPLHAAAATGQVKSAYLLIEGGAVVDALSNDGYSPLMLCMKPELFSDLRLYGIDCGLKEGRARVARLLLEMNADVNDKVIKYAGEWGMNDVIADNMKRLRSMNQSLIGSSFSIATTLLEQREEVVHVKLVDRATEEEDADRYTLNSQLLQHLTRKDEGGDGQPAPLAPSVDDMAPPNVLSTLLDPSSRGFKATEDESAASSEGGKVVKLRYDGSDFTKEGFGVVVEYLTTGRVDHSLVNKTGVGFIGTLTACESDCHSHDEEGGAEGGSRGSAKGKRKRAANGSGVSAAGEGEGKRPKRRRLFDGDLAEKALQAAGYFCLEGMTEEVERLMDVYGFDYDAGGHHAPVASST